MHANALILDHYLSSILKQGKAYNIVTLDVRKAFDTVSHRFITRAMLRMDVPNVLRDYICSDSLMSLPILESTASYPGM